MSGWIIVMIVVAVVTGVNMLGATIGMIHQRRERKSLQSSKLEQWRELKRMKDKDEADWNAYRAQHRASDELRRLELLLEKARAESLPESDVDKQTEQAYTVRDAEGRKFRA